MSTVSKDFGNLNAVALHVLMDPMDFFGDEDTEIEFEDHVDCSPVDCHSAGLIERIYRRDEFEEVEVVVETSPGKKHPGHVVVRLREHTCCPRIVLPALQKKFWKTLAKRNSE